MMGYIYTFKFLVSTKCFYYFMITIVKYQISVHWFNKMYSYRTPLTAFLGAYWNPWNWNYYIYNVVVSKQQLFSDRKHPLIWPKNIRVCWIELIHSRTFNAVTLQCWSFPDLFMCYFLGREMKLSLNSKWQRNDF